LRVSIVTVSYNSEATIADTVRSVAGQSYQNIEHLVIDGQSKDSTIKIVEEIRHPNLILSSERDAGIYDAMNKGFKRASGEVIGFLNSDDLFADPDVLAKVAAAFQDESVQVCYGDLVYVTPNNKRVARHWKSKPFRQGDFAKGWCPAHPTFYVRRSALDRMGVFDAAFKLAADAEFMMRYLEVGKLRSVYIPHVLVRMRLGGATNGSWFNIIKQNKEIFSALQKNGIPFSPIGFGVRKIMSRFDQYISARIVGARRLNLPKASPEAGPNP
jgi:glycosyltransferase involved in cell wall biosynthesis